MTTPDNTTIRVSRADRIRLSDVRAEMVVKKRHHLTVGETVGLLIDFWREHRDDT